MKTTMNNSKKKKSPLKTIQCYFQLLLQKKNIVSLFNCSVHTKVNTREHSCRFMCMFPKRSAPPELNTSECNAFVCVCVRVSNQWSRKPLKPDACVSASCKHIKFNSKLYWCQIWWITEHLAFLKITLRSFCLPSPSSPFRILTHSRQQEHFSCQRAGFPRAFFSSRDHCCAILSPTVSPLCFCV